MAEIQWTVQVKCINALLAEVKVGEKGELIIVNVPDRNFGPSEFDKLIEGLEVAGRIAEKNRASSTVTTKKRSSAHAKHDMLSRNVKILEKRDLYELKFLKTGEIVNVVVPDMLFTPSELDRFVGELKVIKVRMEMLRREHNKRARGTN